MERSRVRITEGALGSVPVGVGLIGSRAISLAVSQDGDDTPFREHAFTFPGVRYEWEG
jgi:hypothetical protein